MNTSKPDSRVPATIPERKAEVRRRSRKMVAYPAVGLAAGAVLAFAAGTMTLAALCLVVGIALGVWQWTVIQRIITAN